MSSSTGLRRRRSDDNRGSSATEQYSVKNVLTARERSYLDKKTGRHI